MQLQKAFSPPSSASSSTHGPGRRVPVSTVPCSTTSRVGTTHAGCTVHSTTAALLNGKTSTTTPTVKRH